MMKLKYFLFYLFLAYHALIIAQPGEKTVNYTDKAGLKQGYWKKNNESGQVKYEGFFKDNKPTGDFTHYYPNGSKKAILKYNHNGSTAFAQLFYETGAIKADGKYVNEKKDSIWDFYDDKGRLTSKENYKDNKKNGKSQIFYLNGQIFEESEWENDVKNGPVIQYYENGKKKEEGVYKAGNYDGKITRYHDTGEKSASGNYQNGLRVGKWYYYDENGIPTFMETIKKGEITNFQYYNGTFDEQFENGIPKLHISYKNGKKNGPFIEYYNKGKFKLVPKQNTDGSPNEFERVLTDTQKRVEGNYFEDKYDGIIIFYTPEGKIEKKEKYNKGVLVK